MMTTIIYDPYYYYMPFLVFMGFSLFMMVIIYFLVQHRKNLKEPDACNPNQKKSGRMMVLFFLLIVSVLGFMFNSYYYYSSYYLLPLGAYGILFIILCYIAGKNDGFSRATGPFSVKYKLNDNKVPKNTSIGPIQKHMPQRFCINCNARLKENAVFCHECGNPAHARARFCQFCGVSIKFNAKFCHRCGNSLLYKKPEMNSAIQLPTKDENVKNTDTFCSFCGNQL